MEKRETITRGAGVAIAEGFAVFTIGWLIAEGQYGRLPLAVATPLLVLLPWMVEGLLRCRVALPVFLFALFYAVGPMLGFCYNWYYTIPWWDKMLHIFGGVMFALLGLFLFVKFVDPKRQKRWMTAVFALCLSVAVAVAWEFFEYGADSLLGMDMQDDTVITHITSYLLDGAPGQAGTIENITAVTINGRPLPMRGYIDIGLNDTMWDMLLESLGAVAVAVWYLWDKDRHPPFRER